jgi:uncharacterized protein
MAVLEEIRIYPVKSLPGIRVNNLKVLPKGLQFDRRLMLTDENGVFMTQRTLPQLSRFAVSLQGTQFMVRSLRSEKEIIINLASPPEQGDTPTVIWDDEVLTREWHKEISEWFSSELDKKCKLMFFPEPSSRPIDPDYAVANDHVSLSDGYPFLIISSASLDELNSRLIEKVTMDRFRPNFVISGVLPYAEDRLGELRIGRNIFAAVKPCSRCVMVTVDPMTGLTGKEPLKTLSEYRTRGGKVYFGMNLIAKTYEQIQEGDEVEWL